MRLPLLLITAPLLLIACSTPPEPIPVKEQPRVIPKHSFSKVLDSKFRGLLTLNEGVGYFKACDTDAKFSVLSSSTLDKIYKKITATPYTPVYIEFSGEIAFNKTDKIDEDVAIRIDRIHHMALAKASLQCAKPINSFLFKATGNDPYWRINIDKEKLFLSTKASNQSYDVDHSNFRSTQINYVYADNTKGQKLKLTIQPGPCFDKKSNEYWGYITEVNSVWGGFNGCGEPGWPNEDHSMNGYYLSKVNNTATNLSLNSDFSVEYAEDTNGTRTIKTGYWRANSPKKISILLTTENQKKIRQELILKRQGLSLTASVINNNHIIEPLKNGPLIFNKMTAQEDIETVAVNRIDREFNAQNIIPASSIDINIQKAVNHYFNIHRTNPKDTNFNAVKYDLNGDGIEEAIVLLDWCSIEHGCEMLIFEGLAEGYRFSSRISRVHAPIIISKTQHYLWQSLLTRTDDSWSILKFDGLSYPMSTRNLDKVNAQDYTSEVVLFSDGKPTQWFPIKM